MKNTVFIIGAGASKEANLPIGNELKREISSLLDMRFDDWGMKQESGSIRIVEALRLLVRQPDGREGDINPYLQEARHIRDALPQAISIDSFIDAHREKDKIALCGKLAIVQSILEAEKRSLLNFGKSRVDSTINFVALEKTWYIPFFKLLTEDCGKNDLIERLKSITLIIFNYDRCIEHFIYYALQNYYRISGNEVAELVESIKIYHPYGLVGSLPWLDRKGSMHYGEVPNSQQLLELYKKIKTYTEGTDPASSEIKEIKERMHLANRLVFLGFAFHKLNMKLISPRWFSEETGFSTIECFATTYEISDSDKEVIGQQIRELYKQTVNVKMVNLACKEFFKEFWRSLNFE